MAIWRKTVSIGFLFSNKKALPISCVFYIYFVDFLASDERYSLDRILRLRA